jgi:predicted nucleotidyltransferase
MVKLKIEFKPKEKILKHLIENKNPTSIREASSATAIDYKNAYNYVGDLTASGAIIQRPLGNFTSLSINMSPNQEIYSVESKRTKEFLSNNPKLSLVLEDIVNLNYPFLIILIFGSYAKNTSTKHSDIDICIISDNKDKTKELQGKLNLLSLNIELHEFTTKEFVSMLEKTANNLGHEIVKSNIILYGIESYYNLISKWMKKE